MNLWLLVMFIIVTPSQPPLFVTLSARTEAGCEQRQAEFIKHLPTPPAAAMGRCVYMPKYLGSV